MRFTQNMKVNVLTSNFVVSSDHEKFRKIERELVFFKVHLKYFIFLRNFHNVGVSHFAPSCEQNRYLILIIQRRSMTSSKVFWLVQFETRAKIQLFWGFHQCFLLLSNCLFNHLWYGKFKIIRQRNFLSGYKYMNIYSTCTHLST